jgi:predicted phage terminase large subunit-like protein
MPRTAVLDRPDRAPSLEVEVGDFRYSEEEVTASVCRESFYEFVRTFWSTIIADEPVWNWHIEYLCGEIQVVMERVFANQPKLYDLAVNVPPGSTKSTLFSVMLTAWGWTRMPHLRVIGASYAYSLATDLARRARDVVKSELYQRVFPDIGIRADQDAKGYFVNSKGGDRFSVGVNGSVTGMHGHVIVVDDPLDPEQALSEADLRTANRWMSETLPSRKVNKAVAPMLLIMQRLHEDDPTGMWLTKQKASPKAVRVKHVCLPAEDSELVSPPSVRRFYRGGLLDPVRMPAEVLEAEYANLGPDGYAGQYDQNPTPRGGGMFKVDRLHVVGEAPRMVWVVRAWDKAGTRGGKGAFTAGVKVGLDADGRVWILDVVRGRWDSFGREQKLKATGYLDGRLCRVVLEQSGGEGGKESAENTVRSLQGFRVQVVRACKEEGSKEERAEPLSSQVNGGNVYLLRAGWNEEFVKEMQYFPRSKYKDQIDAASMGYNQLSRAKIVVGAL